MRRYIRLIKDQIVYSLGDTHGRGQEMCLFVQALTMKLNARGENNPVFVQLGDLCDCFALPKNDHGDVLSPEEIRSHIKRRIRQVPGLEKALFGEPGKRFVDWRLYQGSLRDGEVHGYITADDLINSEDASVISSLYEATMSFETLACFTKLQQTDPDHFIVIFGNHDADLLRGHSDYGRQQKYIFLGLLGFTPDEVVDHMIHGSPDVILRHPWLKWMNERPHMARSADTIYMHGGPTGSLAHELSLAGNDGFDKWLDELETARQDGWENPAFEEHHSFLSPDGADNDWVYHQNCISDFCHAANVRYLAVGHSPFLDFPKGPLIDLKKAQKWRHLFNTPARLRPDGSLIKHDTNLKRGGEFWACRHETGSDVWTGISADLKEVSLPCREPVIITDDSVEMIHDKP